jgi:hypothetical protein
MRLHEECSVDTLAAAAAEVASATARAGEVAAGANALCVRS